MSPPRAAGALLDRRGFLAAGAAAVLARPLATLAQPVDPAVTVTVLGIAQDAGIPHFACREHLCGRARRDPSLRRRVACLGVRAGDELFLVDATPDIDEQVVALGAGLARPFRDPLDGIFLTHAHIGHYLGLAYLGKESIAARGLPVYGTPRMASFLSANGPWRLLVEDGNVRLVPLEPPARFPVAPGLAVESLPVPHREELTDTVGYIFHGPSRSLLYIPDIDRWDDLAPPIESLVDRVDVALLDGSFFDPARELPGRDPARIPHPPIPETMERLAPLARAKQIRFIHLNHTNPAADPDSEERRRIEAAGFAVAREGERFDL